ncbi:hypothetical protein [Mesobacillus subterraneus]|uniref:hypothetical protein n=1 Tax=Mesobacillus subterraneus TaxID=285983 RepID=UPI001CFEBC08|nr:hypothetical protein [Mesobacillus subterraneus]
MKLLKRLHIAYHISLLLFILLIPSQSTDANIGKVILFLTTIVGLIFLVTFYVVISFNKSLQAAKKYSYGNVALMAAEVILFLTLGHTLYEHGFSIRTFVFIFIGLFILSQLLNFKIMSITAKSSFKLMEEVKLFMKVGKAIEETPLSGAISKLDYLFYAFCMAVFIAEDIYIFTGAVIVILLLSRKSLKIIKQEFTSHELISANEIRFAILAYHGFYLAAILWTMMMPNLSAILIGSLSILPIKIYIRRIAEKVYEEKRMSIHN